MKKRIIDFFKEIDFYDKNLFDEIKKNTLVVDKDYEEIREFVGVYKKDDNTYKLILPKIKSIYDELIWVHEYSHIIFKTEGEIFPNVMEAYYVNRYVKDINVKLNIIEKTDKEIRLSDSIIHTSAKKIKIKTINLDN